MSFSEFFKRFAAVLFSLLGIAALWAARSTLLMGFAAALIAVAISIPASRLQRLGWRRPWALVVALIGSLLLLLAMTVWVVPRLLSELMSLLVTIPAAFAALLRSYAALRSSSPFLAAALPEVLDQGQAAVDPEAAQALFTRFLNAGLAIAPSLLSGVGDLATILINVGLVLVIAIFLLIDPSSYVKTSLFLIPQSYHKRAIAIWYELHHTLRTWITTVLLSITITMTLVWVVLGLLLGMPNAMIVAVFAGAATLVPNIGAFLPLIPIAIFTLADQPSQIWIMVPAYLAIQLIESNVITPSLVNAELNIPAGAMLLFQLLMALAFGALGLLLAVPIFAVLIVLVREIYSYDLLHLRNHQMELSADSDGNLTLREHEAEQPAGGTGVER